VFSWIRRLLRRPVHRHEWETTHVNGFMMPTRQECTICGVSRHIEAVPVMYRGNRLLNFWWVYSNGQSCPDTRAHRHLPDDHFQRQEELFA